MITVLGHNCNCPLCDETVKPYYRVEKHDSMWKHRKPYWFVVFTAHDGSHVEYEGKNEADARNKCAELNG